MIDDPLPIECDRCPASETTGARPKFTDTPAGRIAHGRVFNHIPLHLPGPEQTVREEDR